MSIESMQRPEFDIGRVFSATFGAIGRNLVPFGLLALLLSVLPQAAIGWATGPNGPLVASGSVWATGLVGIAGGMLSLAFGLILQAAIIHGAVDDLNDRKASLNACLTTAFRNLGPVLLITILMILGIMLGFVLLIVPGIMLAVMWVVAVPAQVIERRGVFGSFDRSRELTRGSRWAIFGLMVLYVILSWIAGLIILGVGSTIAGGMAGLATNTLMQTVISPLVNGASSLIGAVGTAAIYYELRVAREGIGPQALASVFD